MMKLGMSGFGRHHGIEGFEHFSTLAAWWSGARATLDAFYAPYAKAVAVVDAALGRG